MRKLIFLFPKQYDQCGGHLAQMRFVEIARSFCEVEVVTYKQSVPDICHLDEVLDRDPHELRDCTFVIHWGPDIAWLVKRLRSRNVVYVGHSTEWGFRLPTDIPILAVSRHVQSYWAIRAPSNPIYFLPNVIDEAFREGFEKRDIDVLVMKRKTSSYVLDTLVPLLETRCRVRVLENWTDDIANIMRNSKVFLYDSNQYFKDRGFCEGFGLPPLEALACGSFVFSSLNGALSDYLDPGVNCGQLGVLSPEYDCNNILSALNEWTPDNSLGEYASPYRRSRVEEKMQKTLLEIDRFFNCNEEMVRGRKRSWMPFWNGLAA